MTRQASRSVGAESRKKRGWQVVAFVGLFAVWHLASQWIGETSLAGPWLTAVTFTQWIFTPELWLAIGETLASTMLGMLIACGIAIPAGLLIGSSRFAISSARVSLDFLSSIPPVCFLPLALLMFGPTLPMKLVLIGYGACFPLLIRTIDSLRDIDSVQHDVVDSFGMTRTVRWFRVYLPAAMPGIVVGLRVSLIIALLLSVAAEYVGGAPGVGAELLHAQQWARAADAQVFAVVAAILGLLLNIGLRWFERLVIGWHPSVRSAGTR